jgi:hypothetical protein
VRTVALKNRTGIERNGLSGLKLYDSATALVFYRNEAPGQTGRIGTANPLPGRPCAGSGRLAGSRRLHFFTGTLIARPVLASQLASLDTIVVTTTSSLADLAAEKTLLNNRIISGLRETGLFTDVGAGETGTNSTNGIKVAIEIKSIKKVTDDSRQLVCCRRGSRLVKVNPASHSASPIIRAIQLT